MPLPALMRFFPESPQWPVDSFLSQGNEGISEAPDRNPRGCQLVQIAARTDHCLAAAAHRYRVAVRAGIDCQALRGIRGEVVVGSRIGQDDATDAGDVGAHRA